MKLWAAFKGKKLVSVLDPSAKRKDAYLLSGESLGRVEVKVIRIEKKVKL
jgi:hypothetical protein